MRNSQIHEWHGCYPIQATGIIIGAYNFHTAPLQLSKKELDYLHLKEFLKCEHELYFKQPLTPSQHKIITIPCIIDLSSQLDSGQLSLSLHIMSVLLL